MNRGGQRTNPQTTRDPAVVRVTTDDDATLVNVAGLVDERFAGFGQTAAGKPLVLDVSGITRMTSFGVRQWLKAVDTLPKSDVYLLGCPTFFVDQLNMVLNFGGAAKVLTVVAPYTCQACGVEADELIDVLASRTSLATQPPERECPGCQGRLELAETPESYFAFAAKHGATSLHPGAAQLLASQSLYVHVDTAAEKPPRTIKIVHGSVTYFRIIGIIGIQFRARPFLVGAEGEVVIDLAEVEHFDPSGLKEWRRLLKTLAAQVSSLTLVDTSDAFLRTAGETLLLARNISVATLRSPYRCLECAHVSDVSESIVGFTWPAAFADRVCPSCGGAARCELSSEALSPLERASTNPPPASASLIEARHEILSRALTDASVAQSGGQGAIGAADTILGKYKIVRRLSSGGMADVFLAKQIGIGGFEKPVALKRIRNKLLADRQQSVELFLNEAKIAGRLTHPNIVQVLDVGEDGGALYLAMEYVQGKDLRDVVKKLHKTGERLPLGDACYIVREIALALEHAYWSTDMTGQRLSVVHRDVSPHNVILGSDGTVKLLDFGVAMSAITETGTTLVVGKWMYMAPETTTSSVVDHRSDLFSLGVVLYLLCCGAMPFTGSSPADITPKICAGDYVPVLQLAPEVPPTLVKLIDRLLSADPERRPQRGQDVVAQLDYAMRRHRLHSSGSAIAKLLTELFPTTPEPKPADPGMVSGERQESAADVTARVTEPPVDSSLSSTSTPSAGSARMPGESSHATKNLGSSSLTPRKPRVGMLPLAIQVTPPTPAPPRRYLFPVIMVCTLLAIAGFVAFLVLSRY